MFRFQSSERERSAKKKKRTHTLPDCLIVLVITWFRAQLILKGGGDELSDFPEQVG